MRALGIDYGDARVGIAITDPLGYTAQGLETIHHQGNDKIVLKRLEEILAEYNNEIDTFAIGMPLNMNGTKTERAEVTEKFIRLYKDKEFAGIGRYVFSEHKIAPHKVVL